MSLIGSGTTSNDRESRLGMSLVVRCTSITMARLDPTIAMPMRFVRVHHVFICVDKGVLKTPMIE